MAAQLPTGTVTFLLTDVEGSTRLWEEHPEAVRAALVQHDALIEFLTEQHHGRVVRPRGEDDARFCVFARATDAVGAAVAIQRALRAEPWPTPAPLRVRMALHTGEADLRDGDYYGSAVNRCARLRAVACGGQTLLSAATRDLVRERLPPGASLRDLGEHRLRDLGESERVHQLVVPGLPSEFPRLRSLEALPNNLPLQVTSFVGRDRELAEVRRLLAEHRLVTLTGTGGAGKTRLALQAAAELLDAYPDGAWFVDLAPIADPSLVPQTALTAAGGREVPGEPATSTLVAHLRDKSALLLLDNCEHLIEACARLADELVRGCPGLRVLATSRERLGVAGELPWRVPSLAAPAPREQPPLEQLVRYEAVQLFVERARVAAPGFAPTERNAAALAQVCGRLDGIPLALELAAARVRVLSVEQIAARLDDRFQLLTGGSRTALRRQQTLRATVDWSHDLLAEPERVLLRRLAVFAGGWALEAAEAVCTGEPVASEEVLDLLAALVDKSLVVAEGQDGEERYRLSETLRQYARERLGESSEAQQVRRRHAGYYLALAEQAEPQFGGPEEAVWSERLAWEQDNLRQALGFWEAHGAEREEAEAGLRLATALWRFWYGRGPRGEARAWLATRLALPGAQGHTAVRAKALWAAGLLAWSQGDASAAGPLFEEALALGREVGDKGVVANALVGRGILAAAAGKHPAARDLFEESVARFREAGDPFNAGIALIWWGDAVRLQGDYPAAGALYEESLALCRAVGKTGYLAWPLRNLGYVALHRNEPAGAAALFRQSLNLYRAQEYPLGAVECLAALAGVAIMAGQPERAATLAGAVEALLEAMGARLVIGDRTEYERTVAAARAHLDPAAFAAAWAAGRGLTPEQALAFALEETPEEEQAAAPAGSTGARDNGNSEGPLAPVTDRRPETTPTLSGW